MIRIGCNVEFDKNRHTSSRKTVATLDISHLLILLILRENKIHP